MKKLYLLYCIVIIFANCKEVYNAPVETPQTGYLVVEGFINNGPEPTRIVLTRTTKLYDTVKIIFEKNAQVNIEGDGGDNYALAEHDSGIYISPTLTLNSGEKYRVHIKTSDGKEYLSDYTVVRTSPPIDSITWKLENDGVRIYVNSHDETNSTHYYQWRYTEVWEFHSTYIKRLEYIRDPLTQLILGVYQTDADTSIYKCWHTQSSTKILLGTTDGLSSDKVYLPMRYIEPQSYELSVLYYMKLNQYALSKEAYEFKEKLKKNTEQVGSIFDAQPSELKGNIHCVNNPNEVVIGYVEVSQQQTKDIYIDHDELEHWITELPCAEIEEANKPGSIDQTLLPIDVATRRGLEIATFYAAPPECVDCTLRGSNVKPAFWPR